ncbi:MULTISPECIES: hypothetical protein [unclassified Streptomyces]|uniref:hypothetical protein n=1 Tax=unclassified Streptomyces TaxID=2593676 RepID=UPI002035DEBC|nr:MULTISPECIES: hypothetical protein [unclassified Streptomyces]
MSAPSGSRTGRVRVLIVDDEPVQLTAKEFAPRRIDKGRAPVIHTVRGLEYAIRPLEGGR